MKIRVTVLIVLLAPLLLISCHQKQEQKPNIIYILADDLGYAELGCYGQEKIETPHIDGLARGGMVFTQHYAGSAVCAPSRCVLLTGKHSGHAQIRGNDEWAERGAVWDFEAMAKDPGLEGQRPLTPGTVTLGTLMQKAGYKTGIVGKWGLGGPMTEGIPNEQGFDFFFGYNCQRQAHTYFPVHLWKDTVKVPLNNKMVTPQTKLQKDADIYDSDAYTDFWLEDYASERMQKEVIQFIKEQKDNPFFLYYANPIPHNPLQAPQRWIDFYLEKWGDEDPYDGSRGYFPHRYPHACYAAMVSYLDEQVGEIVEILKELQLYDNTLIIFSSDNGPTYTGGTDSPWFDSAKPFKSEQGWAKGSLNEGGIRVPMIAHWPGKIKAGTKTSLITAFYDILPTLCETTGTDIPDDTDGISFLPTLLNIGNQKKHPFLYWEFPESGGQQAVRMGKWKGMRKNIRDGHLEIQLYDLEQDIQEQNNLAHDYPDIVKSIEEIMKTEHSSPVIQKFRMPPLEKN